VGLGVSKCRKAQVFFGKEGFVLFSSQNKSTAVIGGADLLKGVHGQDVLQTRKTCISKEDKL